MGEHPPGRGDAGRHQEGRPVDGVEAQDVLADHVQIGGPEMPARIGLVRKAGSGDVVRQRIEPDIHHVAVRARHRHAPGEGGAADREILEPRLHETDHLVAPALGRDEVGVRLVEREQPVLPGRETEEPGRLLHPLHRRAGGADPRAVGLHRRFALAVERLVAHRVPAAIVAEIEIARVVDALPERLAGAVVARLGGADEVVVGDVHRARERAEVLRHLVGERFRRHAGSGSGLVYLLAVLVGAGQEEHLVRVEPHEAGEHIAGERGVGVPDMGHVVHIVDRRGDVGAGGVGHRSGLRACREPRRAGAP